MAGQRTQLLWANDGQNVITGLTAGKIYFERDDSNKTSNGFGGGSTSSWHRIDLQGADTLDLQYQSELLAVGGLGTGVITVANIRLAILGLGYEDIVPDAISNTPVSSVDTDEYLNLGLIARMTDHREVRKTHPDDADGSWNNQGIMYIKTPTVGDKTFWNIEIGRRVYDEAVASASPDGPTPIVGGSFPQFRVTGLGVVYVAIPTVTAFDAGATFATTRLKGALRAVMGYEGGSARFRRGFNPR
jgi:hypothetical protein